jgi:hypothetical protein
MAQQNHARYYWPSGCVYSLAPFTIDTEPGFDSGFNYKFNALTNQKNELNDAFAQMFRSGQPFSAVNMLRALSPIFRFLVSSQVSSVPHMFNPAKLAR